ncbi:MAG: hypothetical protein ACJ8AO_17355, partial [Gemmatimonadaceae bacterium]
GALIAAHPHLPASPAAADEARRRLLRWRPASPEHAALREYYLGVVAAASGDRAELAGRAAALGRRGTPADTAPAAVLARDLALALRARLASRDDRREALALLEQMHASPYREEWMALRSRCLERAMTAALLREAGRADEARAWEATIGESYFADLATARRPPR